MSAALGDKTVVSGRYNISEGSKTLKLPYSAGGKEGLGDSPKQVLVTVDGFTFGLTI